MTSLYILQADIPVEASNTLRELSPWAYVIVIFAFAVTGIFIKLYMAEKKQNDELEKEFRSFMSESLSKQIEVSRDVIDLVTRSKGDIKDALNTFTTSDIKIENLITEVKGQLSRIEQAMARLKRD